MKYLLLVIALIFSLSTFGQNKIKIYLKIEIDSNCFRKQKFYSETEKGYIINPNCHSGGNFIYQTKSDTLSLVNLKKFKITTDEEIKKIEKKWRDQKFIEYKKSREKHPFPIHTFDKNYIFDTYLIEIISENKFVVYPVKWRGEGIRQSSSIQNLDNPDNYGELGLYYKDLNNILNPFVGTWQNINADKLFSVNFWVDEEMGLIGHYKMYQLDPLGNIESTIYSSSAVVAVDNSLWPPFTIHSGTTINGFQIINGVVTDNTIISSQYSKIKRGRLNMIINQSTCVGCPITATWLVTNHEGVRLDNESPTFNIPTNIVLTKVQ
jgi:hypothetical protein